MPLGPEVGLGPSDIVLDADPAAPPQKIVYCGQTAEWITMPLGMDRGRPRPRPLCYMGTQLLLPQKGAQPPNFRPMSIVAKRLDGSRCRLTWR